MRLAWVLWSLSLQFRLTRKFTLLEKQECKP